LTPNGKIDRHALPAPDPARAELTETFVAPRNPLEEVLTNIWAEVLGLERVGIHDNFFELGGHSLLTVKLIFRVREVFQVELPLRNLFEAPTVAEFARIIDAVRGVTPSAALPSISATDFKAEATLAPVIYPDAETIPDTKITEPSSIFLTGATGFLGAFLLYELLQQTHADIHCLVRSSNIEEGRKRIQNNLKSYLLWDEHLDSRIIPVAGDLSQPLFGLSGDQFDTLARQIDVIYHNGARVNLIYPYSALKPVNVFGTQETLRLASHIKVKPVHYVSTVSVFLTAGFSKKRIVYEYTPLDPIEELINEGYAQSKWIAEKLLENARSRGIPVTIYRPGTLSGHSQTGVWNTNDVACVFIKGCIQLGKVPYKNVIVVYLTPVDYVSKAIVYLSKQKKSLGQVFHLVNPSPMYWNDVVDWVYAFGYPLQRMSYRKWQTQLVPLATACSQDSALYPLLPVYLEPEPESYELQEFDCQNTLNGLVGTSIVCPSVDTLLHTYFSYFTRSGFLEPPQFYIKNRFDKAGPN
jgi:thioester reductase-like protein